MHTQPSPRPDWLIRRIPADFAARGVPDILGDLRLNTVCRSADCPNLGECFASGTATFLILGSVCTRNCRFCAVPKGRPGALEPDEPERLVEAVKRLGLAHVVITSVTRDDLPDGGAAVFARCITLIREALPAVGVEVLIPDFGGSEQALAAVLEAGPAVLNHNVETVPRLYPAVRPGAFWERSLALLARAAAFGAESVKTGLMLGLGERQDELEEAFAALARAGVTALTLGQYIAPGDAFAPVREWVRPEAFAALARAARACGIAHVQSGPLVRSSYRAGEMRKMRN